MDWRNRKYYGVTFDSDCQELRICNLKQIDGVKVRPFNNTPKQKDEKKWARLVLLDGKLSCRTG